MSRSTRLLAVLQQFEDGKVRTVERIGRDLNMPASTSYRYVRDLVQAGFLDPVAGAGYALGPAFIRYDRILRQSDALIQVADPVMTALLASTSQNATAILCRRFKECVMCVHEVHGNKPHAPTSYERGVAMPMFLGATSKVILAHLPDRALRGIYLANERTIRKSRQTKDWNEFRAQLKEIRQAGFAFTDSEVAKGRIGIAAPIIRDGQAIASLSLVVAAAGARKKAPSFTPHVLAAAKRLSRDLAVHRTIIKR